MFSIKIYTGRPEVQVYFATFNFQEAQNCFNYATLKQFNIYIGYIIENQHLIFTIPKVINKNKLNKVLKPKEVQITHEPTKKKGIEVFISGAVIYDPNSVVLSKTAEAAAKK